MLLLAALGAATGAAATTAASRGSSGLPDRALVIGGGGTATIDVPSVPTNLNPHVAMVDHAASTMVGDAIWPRVFEIGPDLVPQLDTDVITSAELVGVSPQTVEYQINPAAVWSDGVPVTANDFIYAWHAQSGTGVDVTGAPDQVVSTLGYRDIASVTGSNQGKTVQVVFRTPYADWAALFGNLLPAHVAVHAGWNTGFATSNPAVLVSAGPWIVQSFVPGQRIVLVRNPRWWGTPPHLASIVLQAVPDMTVQTADLTAGRAQVVQLPGFDQRTLAAVSSSPQLTSDANVGTTLLQLVLNARHPLLAQIAARQGIADLIDRQTLVAEDVKPLEPWVGMLGNHLFSNAQPGYSDNGSAFHGADLAVASRLLAAAGLATGPHGTWEKSGSPITIDLVWPSDDPWAVRVGPAIAGLLTAGGFDVQTSTAPLSVLRSEILPSGEFDLAVMPVPGTAFASQLAPYFSTSQTSSGQAGTVDWSGLSDPRVDALFAQASQELNPVHAQADYQHLDQLLWADMVSLPLFAEPTLIASSVDLAGVQEDSGGSGTLWHSATWGFLVPGPQVAPGAAPITAGALPAPAGPQRMPPIAERHGVHPAGPAPGSRGSPR